MIRSSALAWVILLFFNVTAARADALIGVPARVETTTSSALFEQSVNHQVGFSIYQADPRLAALFNPAGQSELCGPTTLANLMAYLKLWRSQPFPGLLLSQDPLTGDYSRVVDDFAKRCETDLSNGTRIPKLVSCVQKYFSDSGYTQPDVQLIGTAAQGTGMRAVTLADIRRFVDKDYGLVLEMLWYQFDAQKNEWVNDGTGHYIAVVGYDYDSTWGEHELHLKVVNPNVDYSAREARNRWDSVQMVRYPVKAGVKFPALADYVLDGHGFRGVDKRAFIRNIIAFLPETP